MEHTFLSMSCLSFNELRILFDTSLSTSSKSLRTVSSCCNVSKCNSRNFASTLTLNFRCDRSSTSLSNASIFISISFTIWSCSYSFLWGKQQKTVTYNLTLFYRSIHIITLAGRFKQFSATFFFTQDSKFFPLTFCFWRNYKLMLFIKQYISLAHQGQLHVMSSET